MSQLHGHLCPYRNVWPEAVHCCFTEILTSWLNYVMQSFDSQLCVVIEIHLSKLKKKKNNSNKEKMKNEQLQF